MRLDGIEQSAIHKWKKKDEEDEEEEESEEDDDDEADSAPTSPAVDLNVPEMAKYNRMKKMGMPTHAIVNKMKLDGIDIALVNAFETPNPPSTKKKKKKKKRG